MTDQQTTRIVLADDHPLYRRGLRDVIEANLSFRICGEADDGEEALALIREQQPDIAILDVEMPQCNGIEVARTVQQEDLPVSIIILTMYDDDDLFNDVVAAGVKGYILKDSATLEIVQGIEQVAQGKFFASAAMSDPAQTRTRMFIPAQRERLNLHLLTNMERKVLRLIADDRTTRDISEELYISPRTVDNHRMHICAKLELSGAHALIRFAAKYRSLI